MTTHRTHNRRFLAVLIGLAIMLVFTAQSAATTLVSAHHPAGATGATKASKQAKRAPRTTGSGWNLIFNQDFEGGQGPDPSLWAPGWFAPNSAVSQPVNSTESACYNSANIGTGSLGLGFTLSASPSTCAGQTRPYTGALLTTNPGDGRKSGGFQYRYGLLQARMYLPPVGNGSQVANWPVLMTLGQPSGPGEDDIVEGLDGAVCAHYHSPQYGGYLGIGGCDRALGPGWHTFTVDWEPGSITWYYDGKRFASATRDITSAPMYIVLGNTAASASWAGQVTAPGTTMTVAYVKIWQHS